MEDQSKSFNEKHPNASLAGLVALVGLGSFTAGFYRGYSDDLSMGEDLTSLLIPALISTPVGGIGFWHVCEKPDVFFEYGVLYMGAGAAGGAILSSISQAAGYVTGKLVQHF